MLSTPISGKLTSKIRGGGRTTQKEIANLRRRLADADEHFRSLIESKEASDEEYQSANEEILSANEELQSTNEELETSKEELQSANEELNTVNDELHNRNIELDRLNSDLRNLLSSTNLPVVMVDRGVRIRRLTAASAKVLKIVASDIGRPITDIRWDIDVPNLDELIVSVIETLTPKELEMQDKSGHWYSLQIRPYRTRVVTLAVSAPDFMQRLSGLPSTPNLTLIDRRKPEPPSSHSDTTFPTQIYIRWCCIDLSNAPH